MSNEKQNKKELIDKIREDLKTHPVVIDMFDKHDVDIEYIDLMPMKFGDIDVSARTDQGVITFSNNLLYDGFDDDDHYIVHEVTHVLQQCFGDKATTGSTDGEDYLNNKYEQEAFQFQTDFIEEEYGEEAKEQYVEKVLDHHDIKKEDKKSFENKITSSQRFSILKRIAQLSRPERESAQWIPNQIYETEIAKKWEKTQDPQKDFSKYGLNDFRYGIDTSELDVLNKTKNINVIDSLIENLLNIKPQLDEVIQEKILNSENYADYLQESLTDELSGSSQKEINQRIKNLPKDAKEIYKLEKMSDLIDLFATHVAGLSDLKTNTKIGPYQSGMSVFRLYNNFKKDLSKVGINIPEIDEIPAVNEFHHEKAGTEIVFSTKQEDIAGMGSRGVASCQKLTEIIEGDEKELNEYNRRLLGSMLDKNIGIIYLTPGSDFKGRGDKMLSRALVKIGVNAETKEPIFVIDQMYPNDNFKEQFKKAIQSNTNVPVYTKDEASQFAYLLRDERVDGYYQSYVDENKENPSLNYKPKEYFEGKGKGFNQAEILALLNKFNPSHDLKNKNKQLANFLGFEFNDNNIDYDHFVKSILVSFFSQAMNNVDFEEILPIIDKPAELFAHFLNEFYMSNDMSFIKRAISNNSDIYEAITDMHHKNDEELSDQDFDSYMKQFMNGFIRNAYNAVIDSNEFKRVSGELNAVARNERIDSLLKIIVG